MLSSSDKTATNAASMLISLGSQGKAVKSSISSLVFPPSRFGVFYEREREETSVSFQESFQSTDGNGNGARSTRQMFSVRIMLALV